MAISSCLILMQVVFSIAMAIESFNHLNITLCGMHQMAFLQQKLMTGRSKKIFNTWLVLFKSHELRVFCHALT